MNIKKFFSSVSDATTPSTSTNTTELAEEVLETMSIEDEEKSEDQSDIEVLSPRKRKKKSHREPKTRNASGGKSKFQPEYAIEYSDQTIERSKTDGKFFCRACGQDYNLDKKAAKNIKLHINTDKHKKNLNDYNRNRVLTGFVKTKKPSQIKQDLAAELTMAYHLARHNFSLNSANCNNKILPILFSGSSAAENYASARHKTTALINGVLQPYLKNQILLEIEKSGGYFSVGIDSTSLNESRIFAIVIRYFHEGTKTRILELVEQPGEKALETVNLLKQSLANNKLAISKMISICMDNTNSTFGGQQRRGKQNVFYHLKQDNPNLVGIGCTSHISNNAVRYGLEQFDYPVVPFANALTAHFSNSALRSERYTEFCSDLNLPVKVFPDFAPTRWLSFGRLSDEINRSWAAIESYFRSEQDCPKFLRKIFCDESTLPALEFKAIFQFFSFNLAIFIRFNTISQTPTLHFPRLARSLNELKTRLRLSLDEKDFGEATLLIIQEIEYQGAPEICARLKEAFLDFYSKALDYLERWTQWIDEIDAFTADWLIFESQPSVQTIKAAYRKYCSTEPKDLDELFLEIGSLKEQLARLNLTAFAERNVDEKWTVLFQDPSFVHLKRLVTMLLSTFSSNAFCESIFSVVKNLKTNERNRMKIKLLNSLVSIKFNSDFDCLNAYDIFISNQQLLDKVKNSEKYAE